MGASPITAMSQFLAVSFEGVEHLAIELFTALKRELLSSGSFMNNRRV